MLPNQLPANFFFSLPPLPVSALAVFALVCLLLDQKANFNITLLCVVLFDAVLVSKIYLDVIFVSAFGRKRKKIHPTSTLFFLDKF